MIVRSMLFLPYWKHTKIWVHWRMTRCSVPSAWVPVRFSRLELSAATSSTMNIHSRGHILDWNEHSNWMSFLISISFCQLSSHFMLFIESDTAKVFLHTKLDILFVLQNTRIVKMEKTVRVNVRITLHMLDINLKI